MKIEQILVWNVTARYITSIKRNFAALVFHVCDGQEQGAVKILGPRRLENSNLLHMPAYLFWSSSSEFNYQALESMDTCNATQSGFPGL